ncbi:hypothetical protein ASZ90_004635 [hydrocarbon metagenome]|uniref:Activator of Hsp90 ATPase homologue 1/2-like C-terminal domain-containing protein n=1 Tax=hydrocarbon metagenome TaxID=938273 RepID=A0A0W8FXF9_9ZZZZ
MKKNNEPIIVEQIFENNIQRIWNSITDIKEMHNWYFENIPSFLPEVGFKTQFNIQSEERNFLHIWQVIEVIPARLIKYNWKYEGYNGDSNVTFELFDQNDKTKLRLTVEILEDFSEDIPEFRRESCINGWNYFIQNRLKEYLEKNK